jgi:hypothetical protein
MKVDWGKVGLIAGVVGLFAWLATAGEEKEEENKGIAVGEPNGDVKGLGGLKKKKKKSKK